jgi:long-chain acyl-CoA synthetase
VIVEDPLQLEMIVEAGGRARLENVAQVVLLSEVARADRADRHGHTARTLDDVVPPDSPERTWIETLERLRVHGRDWLEDHPGALERAAAALRPQDPFTIVYTSGTTGPPKGAVLTHRNIVFETEAVLNIVSLDRHDVELLFLPLAHVLARLVAWLPIRAGFSLAFAESLSKAVDDFREVEPTLAVAVPRVFEKAYGRIQASLAEKRKQPVTRALLDWAFRVGRRGSAARQAGRTPRGLLALELRLADELVFAKIREVFGQRLRFFVSGGAPLSREIAEFFHVVGIQILEGYGLTETTGATHVNRPDAYRLGTVGLAIPGVECRIALDGEILVRGPNIMAEYFGRPDETREAIDAEGWFHTGDIGEIDARGFLRVTDRKKDLIVTAGGKKVPPQNLEAALKSGSAFISQVLVYGDQRPFVTALITLDEECVRAWAAEHGLEERDFAALAGRPEVRALVQQAVDRLNAGLASYESIRKFAIVPTDFTQEGGELTPTLKVKRKVVVERYRPMIEGLYGS